MRQPDRIQQLETVGAGARSAGTHFYQKRRSLAESPFLDFEWRISA
jgi:hypothetical protein